MDFKDFSNIDFNQKPQFTLADIPPPDQDDEDILSQYLEVASFCEDYSLFGSCSSLYVENRNNEFVYIQAYPNWSPEDFEDGENSITCSEPLTLLELLQFIETWTGEDQLWSPWSAYVKVAVEDYVEMGREIPPTLTDIEFFSEYYPGFVQFYEQLGAYLLSFAQNNQPLPNQAELSGMIHALLNKVERGEL